MNNNKQLNSGVVFTPDQVETEHPFVEPWQAQAFAMAVMLNEQGVFSWSEWAEVFSDVLAAAGLEESPDNYYLNWMAALEKIVSDKGLMAAQDLVSRKAEWDTAAKATPHGQPIML